MARKMELSEGRCTMEGGSVGEDGGEPLLGSTERASDCSCGRTQGGLEEGCSLGCASGSVAGSAPRGDFSAEKDWAYLRRCLCSTFRGILLPIVIVLLLMLLVLGGWSLVSRPLPAGSGDE
jgi:hypothetical protein